MTKEKERVINTLTERLGAPDRFGNWKFSSSKSTYRLKPQSKCLRLEMLMIYGDSKVWSNISRQTLYYGKVNCEKLLAFIEARKAE